MTENNTWDIISLEELKKFIPNVSEEFDDENLFMYLRAAEDIVKNFTSREIWKKQEVIELYNWYWINMISLRQLPVSEIISIKELNWDGEYKEIWFKYYHNDRDIYFSSNLNRGVNLYKIKYSAGFEENDIPNDVKMVISRIASNLINTNESQWILNEKVQNTSVSYGTPDQNYFWLDNISYFTLLKYKRIIV